jgi:CheY-specific phosphatase CheX
VIRTEQRRSDRLFGEIAVLKGFLSRQQLDDLLREQKEARVLLGDALVKQGYLSWEQVASAYKAYQGEQQAAEQQIQRTLAAIENKLLVNTTVQMSSRMLLRMGGQISKLAAVDDKTRLVPREYLFWQEVEGDLPFTYYMSISSQELILVSRNILEAVGDPESPEDVDMIVLDVGKEFVNIVVGHICTRLSHEGLNTMPLPPDHAEGQDFQPPQSDGMVQINIRLVMPLGEVALSLHCPPGDDSEFPTSRISADEDDGA